ncbi:hypothetical protein BCR33DRAFT_724505 [Rhizoclosmatium globosum]|uniref:Uncharacterized protein n=1 Tax=Rhizoclosmatium globosum TaxID=329046 RepID=A0A1Y2B6J4_9FUNG|nr:hypothetical protein BCR33DRAFT_724505 [Rhizoclosmatium globosum]|eukprot:ORY30160.1 hypothetical protein BCR33DRAFT_724505 [Rhizoclosmatium globosum]
MDTPSNESFIDPARVIEGTVTQVTSVAEPKETVQPVQHLSAGSFIARNNPDTLNQMELCEYGRLRLTAHTTIIPFLLSPIPSGNESDPV